MVTAQQLALMQEQKFRFWLNRRSEGPAIQCALPAQMIHHPSNKYDSVFGTASVLPEDIGS